ncbi:MAG TPA: cyclodeaminase/cyclohydrolase family protein, partial [Roseiflexaceae bacterium]|nr:cyclodeaminase/cyclohydrolase family protein [Roseiflexaceae bacterium]
MSDTLLDQTLNQFLDNLASKSPTPGGGSIAALSGAMAAGLITMVCDLTIGRKQYAEFEEEAQRLRERSETLRAELQQLAQA